MTVTKDNFFKPGRAEDELALNRAPGALDIVEAEAAVRAEKTKRLREARLQTASSGSDLP
jgi:hypothetical protein